MTPPEQGQAVSEPDELTREFTQLYQDWFARVGPDPGDFFERVLSTDWVYIDYLGKVRGKADYEPYVAAVPPERVPTHVGNLGVRRFGDLAIVHGSYEAPGGRDDVDRTLWFTAVWIHRQGRWQALAHHTSAVAA